jgi:hypothetical protein
MSRRGLGRPIEEVAAIRDEVARRVHFAELDTTATATPTTTKEHA